MLVLRIVSCSCPRPSRRVLHTLGIGEVYHISVFLEHIDLLNGLDILDLELAQSTL